VGRERLAAAGHLEGHVRAVFCRQQRAEVLVEVGSRHRRRATRLQRGGPQRDVALDGEALVVVEVLRPLQVLPRDEAGAVPLPASVGSPVLERAALRPGRHRLSGPVEQAEPEPCVEGLAMAAVGKNEYKRHVVGAVIGVARLPAIASYGGRCWPCTAGDEAMIKRSGAKN
jgi:hypothetical protein